MEIVTELMKIYQELYGRNDNLYIVARNPQINGCIALADKRGKDTANFVSDIEKKFDGLEIVVITRPEAYGEYNPYTFVLTREQFINEAKCLQKKSGC